jgi:Protein of unknown function (DUF2568)
MAALRVFNLGVRFLLELASLAAFGYWGATLRTTGALRALLAIAIPLAVALLWGLFISPKARYSTGRPGQVGLGLLVFLVAALLLRERGHAALAAAFAGVAVISSALLYLLPQ